MFSARCKYALREYLRIKFNLCLARTYFKNTNLQKLSKEKKEKEKEKKTLIF